MKNKLFSLIMLSILTLFCVNNAKAYTFKQFLEETISDTKVMYKSKPEFKIGVGYGLVSHTPQYNGSIPVLSWRFLDAGPLVGYNTDGSQKTGKFGGLLTIRLGKIPLGDNTKVEDVFNLNPPQWLSKYWIGLGPMYDFTNGAGVDFLLNLGWRF